MALLQAAVSPSATRPNSQGGGDISVVDGTALVAENGPLSQGADIPSEHISTYVVRNGDTLSQIAEMYDVSVNTIIWANDLKNRTIREGQVLVILPVSGVKYEVKAGDTLSYVAKKFKADAEEVRQFNNLPDSGKLAVGESIIIPDGDASLASQAVPSSGSKPASNSRSSVIARYPTYEGYYMRPLEAGTKSQGLHGYNGVDIAAPVGTPIFAAAAGEVIVARSSGWNGGYGEYVVIEHPNGTQTLYSHLSQVLVTSGISVFKGQVIGYVGNTGKSTGPHLHFEIRGAKNPF